MSEREGQQVTFRLLEGEAVEVTFQEDEIAEGVLCRDCDSELRMVVNYGTPALECENDDCGRCYHE